MKKEHPREDRYRSAITARLQLLRKAMGKSQPEMAEALGVPLDRYRKYETRTPLPGYLIEPLAELTGYSVHFIVTGRGSAADSVLPYTGINRRRTG
jgi:transcriptional regulator with XRE-family HTH domain